MENKCFAFNNDGGCDILTDNAACGNGCSFFKTAEQLEDQVNRVNKRLSALDPKKQTYIADKYFNGAKKWIGKKVRCADCRFAYPDWVMSEECWTAYQCGNRASEYYRSLLNVTVDGEMEAEVTWSGCFCGEDVRS